MSTPPVTNPSDYDSFAEEYSSENASSLLNEYYERPAMLALAGDVSGRSVLDAGCGSGPLSSALLQRGASVSGFDLSAEMLKIAATRLGPGVELKVADLAEDGASMAHGFHHVAGAGLTLGADHGRAFADAAGSLTQIAAAAHKRHLEGVL